MYFVGIWILHVLAVYDIAWIVLAEYGIKATDAAKCCHRLPNSTLPDTQCTPTKLTANHLQQFIATPGYPGPFPADLFCTWEVRAIPGRRIWLDFRNLHLVRRGEEGCDVQKLIIRSPLTGLSMGPFCGHDGLPNIVSTGNHLIVELESPRPTGGADYKGFEMVYMETVQSTSPELRPLDWSDGMFMESPPEHTSKPTKPSRYQPPRRKTTLTKVTKPKPTPPPRRKYANPTEPRTIIPLRPYTPPRRNQYLTPRTDESGLGLGTNAIVGIVVGGFIFIAVISVVVAKVGLYRSKKKRKKEENDGDDPPPTQGGAEAPAYRRSALPWVAADTKSVAYLERKVPPITYLNENNNRSKQNETCRRQGSSKPKTRHARARYHEKSKRKKSGEQKPKDRDTKSVHPVETSRRLKPESAGKQKNDNRATYTKEKNTHHPESRRRNKGQSKNRKKKVKSDNRKPRR